MGIFSKIKNGISSKANAALDKAIDPEKELDMAIMELEEGRKKALQELISYKATAKQMEAEVEKQKAKAAEWEKRAIMAVKAGNDEAAKEALKQKRACDHEAIKIERDKHEAASYAIQLNKSRKEFETKLQILKLRKGTLATQIAAARSPGGDAFGNDSSVWDKFKAAEDRIDQEAIESEVDASMRGEDVDGLMLDAKLQAAAANAGLLASGDPSVDDPLHALKTKMAADKAAKQKQLGAGAAPAAAPAAKPVASTATPEPKPASAEAKPAASPPTQPATSAPTKPAASAPTKPASPPTKPASAPAPTNNAKPAAPPTKSAPAPAPASPSAKPAATPDADAKQEAEPPRPEVKIDMAKLEAELAALRDALKNEK
jgi:phage shock protein A